MKTQEDPGAEVYRMAGAQKCQVLWGRKVGLRNRTVTLLQ